MNLENKFAASQRLLTTTHCAVLLACWVCACESLACLLYLLRESYVCTSDFGCDRSPGDLFDVMGHFTHANRDEPAPMLIVYIVCSLGVWMLGRRARHIADRIDHVTAKRISRVAARAARAAARLPEAHAKRLAQIEYAIEQLESERAAIQPMQLR